MRKTDSPVRRHSGWVVAFVAAALATAGLGGTATGSVRSSVLSAAANGTPLTLYGIFPTTGPPAQVPYPEEKVAFDAAVKEINNAGGIKGHPIRGVACDDQISATAAANCAQSAVNAGALAVVHNTFL